jgi:RNA polymerase primary sigma factor
MAASRKVKTPRAAPARRPGGADRQERASGRSRSKAPLRTIQPPAEAPAAVSAGAPAELAVGPVSEGATEPAGAEAPVGPEPVERSRAAYDGDTAIKLYLREIGLVHLLTPQEEIELAARIRKGDRRARERMIKANLRLVVKIAHDYEGLGLPLLDLINEGNIGLMKAVERFDPGKGGKLSTYGAWWIKQSIKRALANQSKTIRLPVHLVDKISKMRRLAMHLQDILGREPTDEELGEELGMPAGRVAHLRSASVRPTSLDAPIGDDDSNSFSDVVQDERADSPYQLLEDKTVTSMLREMIERLEERESTILRYRFGLDGGPERTLEEVGARFGVTRERVRQVQNIALTKLRRMIEKLEAVKS